MILEAKIIRVKGKEATENEPATPDVWAKHTIHLTTKVRTS